ncbi:sugar phosphate isomerase/epimerase family protein [Pseudomonas syringae]|uniref:sugar phosphate isomerase/epimerase family protein n=1 Tax=Pseudomonas syringae TaxID=317 RepID=UPI003F776A3A
MVHPDLRLGASSASLASLSPEHLVDELAQLGYQGVEWRVADTSQLDAARAWNFRDNNRCTLPPNAIAIERISRHCEASGIKIFGLSPYLEVGDIEQSHRLIELAETADHARLRLWAPGYQTERYQEAYGRMRRFLDQIVPYAQARGVQLALEVHQRTICSSPSLAMRVAEHYPHRALGVIYDMGNLAIEGREDVQLSLDLMGAHLAHVQVKNVSYKPTGPGQGWAWDWCPPDEGFLPLEAMLSTLHTNGFHDWVSVEDFSTTYDDQHKLLRNRDLIQAYMGLNNEPASQTAKRYSVNEH